MVWAKFSDDYNDDPRIIEVGPLAATLHARAIIYCCRHLTDGKISEKQCDHVLNWDLESGIYREFVSNRTLLGLLCDAGLFRRTSDPNVYEINEFLKYNPSKREVVGRRKQDAKRQKKARKRRAKTTQKHAESLHFPNSNGDKDRHGGIRLDSERIPSGVVADSARNPSVPYPAPIDLNRSDRAKPRGLEPTALTPDLLDYDALIRAGRAKFGQAPLPKTASAIRERTPVTRDELAALLASRGRRWAYVPKVLDSWRQAGNLGRPLAAHTAEKRTGRPESDIAWQQVLAWASNPAHAPESDRAREAVRRMGGRQALARRNARELETKGKAEFLAIWRDMEAQNPENPTQVAPHLLDVLHSVDAETAMPH